MSSVVISGDTSGAITIAAPAVAGTNTATLQAVTGTVALTSDVIGVNQTWQNLTASRALGTTYTNSTGKPIFVSIRGVSPAGSTSGVSLVVDSITLGYSSAASSNPTLTVGIVPNGSTYSATANSCTLGAWLELR